MSDWKKFETTATEVVIDFLQNDKNEIAIRNDALLALIFRFREDLLNKCEKICKGRGYDKDVAQLIAERTFTKYGKSKKFNKEQGNYECVDTCFKLYLYKIASNELKSFYHEESKRKKGLLYDGTENIVTQLPEVNLDDLDYGRRIIHETLLELPYSHQVIYLTYKMHEREGINLPRSLQSKIREHLGGISQNTVRFYKKEANDKIETARKIIAKLS
jgi:hypothetical protein